MARQFNGVNQYLEIDTEITPAAWPYTLACWFNEPGDGNFEALIAQAERGVVNEYEFLCVREGWGNRVAAVSRVGGIDWAATTVALYVSNTWNHAGAVFAGRDDRRIYLNGANKVVNNNITGDFWRMNRTSIGRIGSNPPGRYTNARIAEAAAWNVALSDAEIAILAKGYRPTFVRPQNLICYLPLVRDDDEDIVGGRSFTAFNAPSIAAHPP